MGYKLLKLQVFPLDTEVTFGHLSAHGVTGGTGGPFMKSKSKGTKLGVPFEERLGASIRETMTATGLSKGAIYKLIRAGRIRVAKAGTRTVVHVPSLLKLWDTNERGGAAPDAA